MGGFTVGVSSILLQDAGVCVITESWILMLHKLWQRLPVWGWGGVAGRVQSRKQVFIALLAVLPPGLCALCQRQSLAIMALSSQRVGTTGPHDPLHCTSKIVFDPDVQPWQFWCTDPITRVGLPLRGSRFFILSSLLSLEGTELPMRRLFIYRKGALPETTATKAVGKICAWLFSSLIVCYFCMGCYSLTFFKCCMGPWLMMEAEQWTPIWYQ